MVVLFGLAASACRNNDDGTCIVSTVSIAGAPATINVGNSDTLTAQVTATSCSGLQVVWTSSADSVLRVDQHGALTAVAAGGPVTITAIAGTLTATTQITVVTLPIAAVAVVPDSLVVPSGGTFQLLTRLTAADSSIIASRPVSWSSAAPGVAAVGNNGFLTGVARGSTQITATSEGHAGVAKVFVAAPRLFYMWNDLSDLGVATPPDSNYFFGIGGLPLAGSSVVSVASPVSGTYNVTWGNFSRAGAETDALFLTQIGGADAGFCTNAGWTDSTAQVRCFDRTGSASQTPFDLVAVGSATYGARFAYAWANDGTPSVPYDAPSGYRYSSSGQPITITRTALGIYSITFAGQGRTVLAAHEALMVSTWGTTAVACQLSDWTTAVATDLTATVRCFTAGGVAADGSFTIGLVSAPRSGATLAFADAAQPTTVTYTPANSAVLPTGLSTITRFGAGNYSVRFDGLARGDSTKESFLITPVSEAAVRCHIATGGWTFDLGGATVPVTCVNPAGSAIDTRFVIVGLQ
ncbi:MAG TPA: Ig-like domain-containing protein [Gemmatimonadales bacterium]